MLTHTSDAGRSKTHPFETRDCSVIALAHSVGISYAEAHTICAQQGRRNRRGMRDCDIQSVLTKMKNSGQILDVIFKPYIRMRPAFNTCSPAVIQGYRMYARRPRQTGSTVAAALRHLPRKGRFYLTCTSHAFAYVDGVLFDNLGKSKMRALMTSCWEIIQPAQPTIEVLPQAAVVAPAPPAVEARPRFDAAEYQRRAVLAKIGTFVPLQ
jgi:hypothetical protein